MTEIRKEVLELFDRIPDDKIVYLLQIMRGMEGLYGEKELSRKSDAYNELKKLQFSAPDLDEKKELERYREERYADTN